MSRPRANLADLQVAHRNGEALRVASVLLGAPPEEFTVRPSYKGHTVDELFPQYPSSWLGRPTDAKFAMTERDLEAEVQRLADEMYPDPLRAEEVRIAVMSVMAGIVSTPMEKVIARMYREVLRDLGGRYVTRKSTATSMKKRPRNYGPCSEVVTTDANGDKWSEDGRLLTDKKAAKKLRKLPAEQ